MGQKVNPKSFRVAIRKDWDSLWCFRDGYRSILHQDIQIREFIQSKFRHAMISRVLIKRQDRKISVVIYAARAGVIIGKNGEDIDIIRKKVFEMTQCDNIEVNVSEIRRPEICAQLVAFSICQQLEKRVSFRRAIKRSVSSAMRSGAKGIRINCSGRLGGAEIARGEWYREGSVPLHTLRSNIEYGFFEANTSRGVIGVKTWVYLGVY